MDDALDLTRSAILNAFQVELACHKAHLPELAAASMDVSFGPPHSTLAKPTPQPNTGKRQHPALVVELSWPPAHTGPLSTCRQFIAGERLASLLDCDLVTLDERELVRTALHGEPMLADDVAGRLTQHLRANEQGCAKCLELMNQVAAICTVPNRQTAAEYEAQVAFNWEAGF